MVCIYNTYIANHSKPYRFLSKPLFIPDSYHLITLSTPTTISLFVRLRGRANVLYMSLEKRVPLARASTQDSAETSVVLLRDLLFSQLFPQLFIIFQALRRL